MKGGMVSAPKEKVEIRSYVEFYNLKISNSFRMKKVLKENNLDAK